jgi:hypothetical protein
MNMTVRALVIALGVLRVLPAQLYITLGIICTAFIAVASPGVEPLATFLTTALTLYGGWRGLRRQRALHGFMKWTP